MTLTGSNMIQLTQRKPNLNIGRELFRKHNNSYNPAMHKQTLSNRRLENSKIRRLVNLFNLSILQSYNLLIDVGKRVCFHRGPVCYKALLTCPKQTYREVNREEK